jgi:hypothetical protein
MTARQLVQVPVGNETEMCGSAIMHEMRFLTNDQFHVGQEIWLVDFKESFLIPPCKPVWKYMGSVQIRVLSLCFVTGLFFMMRGC